MEEILEGIKIFFITRNAKITDYVKDYFKEKFIKIIPKIPEGIRDSTSVYFILKKEGESKSIELILTIKKSHLSPIYTEEEGDDLRAVIDKIVYEIERQMDKLRTEFENIIRDAMKSKREIHTFVEEREEKSEPQDVQIDTAKIKIEKPMSIDDAIIILEDLEKKRSGRKIPIYIFNDFDGKVKVLYKQSEKKYVVFEIS
ncbi:MAG: HPF/RaiA family ribosome-associated protein [Candidatus Calescibacterium sp.]|nr:HPF/RaiA family ribosome-associated protein [Candidatus Calescibacterium sp.]MCX7733640.1 HPF/RaiA family ribosome-associated protein [bacterium]MDW8087175.1 HPF/RaiA family ribosome-associated protein [Candidatus Calescibacterium sp.]